MGKKRKDSIDLEEGLETIPLSPRDSSSASSSSESAQRGYLSFLRSPPVHLDPYYCSQVEIDHASNETPRSTLTNQLSGSSLVGERLLSPGSTALYSNHSDRISILTHDEKHPWHAEVWRTVKDEIQMVGESISRWRRGAPMSPRSRNLADLNYLTQQHQSKLQQWNLPEDSRQDDGFEFCLILKPQEVYAYWSTLLDFRVELLGEEKVALMEENWSSLYDTGVFFASTDETSSSGSSGTPSSAESSDNSSEARDTFDELQSPTTGIRRRGKTPTTPSNNVSHSTASIARPSPSLYSVADSSFVSVRSNIFDRAVGPLDANSSSTSPVESPTVQSQSAKSRDPLLIPPSTIKSARRRWGNHTAMDRTPTLMSPPIRSLTRGTSTVKKKPISKPEGKPPSVADTKSGDIEIEDIPNQVIPRGIANRTNGLLSFLSAIKRGILVRRHRPGQEAIFCKLVSVDGGDTIQCLSCKNPFQVFREQNTRYNKDGDEPQTWSVGSAQTSRNDSSDMVDDDAMDLPNHKQKLLKQVNDIAKRSFKASEIVAVRPATKLDPRNSIGEYGSATLRKSKSEYAPALTFSIVLRTGQRVKQANIEDLSYEWEKGLGSDSQFRYVDFEMATPSEYWLVFRGFLFLHRDASIGRYAAQRAAGIGSHVGGETCVSLHRDQFHEPVTVDLLEKMIVQWRQLDATYMEGYTVPGAVPPPSDFFLGFKSPGTTVWSRLRFAGLETERVYSLDPRTVMLKIRCPEDRLYDVAEVLRLKCKTMEGNYVPFREDMIDLFEPIDNECEPGMLDSKLRSSLRQTIIDFIIGSRIRDTGAELGHNTDVGKMIQARVPFHMQRKLEAIYRSWVLFWKEDNWQHGRHGSSMLHQQSFKSLDDANSDMQEDNQNLEIPSFAKRFFHGCFFQPLDSVEQYFGEKVAFYFAWLQHTALHLVFLSVAGLLLFFCQVASNDWNHPLRPLFAVMVMLWTFIVLINWKKRANYLAYHWGTMDYKEEETTRPQFRGDYSRDPITGEWIVTYPKWKRWTKYMISFPLTIMFTGGTLILILLVHANRDVQLANYMLHGSADYDYKFGFHALTQKKQIVEMELTRDKLLDPMFWFIVVGMPSCLGLFLPLLNFVLMNLSILLNDFENYRTESEYRSFLIIKVFSFRFICYFATLYYYAFVSVGDERAIENGILRIGTGVLVYTTVAQWWQNFLHVCFPIFFRKLRLRHRAKRLRDELRAIEVEEEEISRMAPTSNAAEIKARQVNMLNKRLLLEQAQDERWLELMNPKHDSFPEYIQAVVQFTFVSCFSVVLPIAPLICLINYLISMRLDAYKLCKGRRRPLAEKTGGIGVWEHLLHIVAVISILTNCWLMGFTSKIRDWTSSDGDVNNVALFALVVGWEHIMLLIKYVMQTAISPLPRSVRDAQKKEQFELSQQQYSSIQARRMLHQKQE